MIDKECRNQKAGNDLRAFRWGTVADHPNLIYLHPTLSFVNKASEKGSNCIPKATDFSFFFCSVAFARVGGFAWLPWGLAPKPPGFFAFLQQRRHGAPGRGAFDALRPGAAVCVTFACSGCFPAVPYPRQCDGCFVAVLFLLRKIEIRIAEQTIHQYH